MSDYIAKASIEPRDYRVVFLIQKKRRLHSPLFQVLSLWWRLTAFLGSLFMVETHLLF